MKTFTIPFLLLILSFSSACQNKSFEDKLINTFKEKGINTEEIDWQNFESEVKTSFKKSRVEGIKKALTLYGNKHTFYRYKGETLAGDINYQSIIKNCNYFEKTIFDQGDLKGLGYVNIPTFGLNPELTEEEKQLKATAFVENITKEIKRQDSQSIKGWIIDLRFNGGGNMWPMLLALRPFFTQETLGYFIKGSDANKWSFKKGDIYIGWSSQKGKYLTKDLGYNLKNKDPKIAVLIGGNTSSSGEATAIALGSVKNMKYFGDYTSGYSTANQVIKMADDEFLILTSSVMADHNKKTYWDGLKVNNPICEEDELLKHILDWIND